MKTRWIMRIVLVGWVLAFSLPSSADAPVEEFYPSLEKIPPAVLRNAQGALSVYSRDPAYAKQYLNQHVDPVKVPTYVRRESQFLPAGVMNLEDTRPFSGWLFNEARVRRFPVVAKAGDHVEIVYDVQNDRRAWVRLADISNLMPKGWPQSARLVWFSDAKFSNEGDGIDIFLLLAGQPKQRRLYTRPRADAPDRLVTADSQWLQQEAGSMDGYLVVTRQVNGFAQLGLFNSCTGEVKPLKWVRIRDQDGRLTLWPVAGLSC